MREPGEAAGGHDLLSQALLVLRLPSCRQSLHLVEPFVELGLAFAAVHIRLATIDSIGHCLDGEATYCPIWIRKVLAPFIFNLIQSIQQLPARLSLFSFYQF